MNAVNADWPGDVFDGLLSQIVEFETKFILDLIVHDTRNHNAAGLSQCFQPRRHIDAITKNVVTVDNDITDIDADAELDAFLGRDIGVAFDHAALDVDDAAHRVDDTSMLDEHAVAGGLDDPAPVLSDLGINEFLAMRFELAQRAFLINAHEPAVAGNIACPYRSKSAIDAVSRHLSPRKS
ncbi:MAG TPA: hypothetical protein VLU23_19070 [Pseudolabrys sp.]|nr:hypothetical protein [Pseudolabrys sp.]